MTQYWDPESCNHSLDQETSRKNKTLVRIWYVTAFHKHVIMKVIQEIRSSVFVSGKYFRGNIYLLLSQIVIPTCLLQDLALSEKSALNQVRIAIMDSFDVMLSSNSLRFVLSLTCLCVKTYVFLDCFDLYIRHLPYSIPNAWNRIDGSYLLFLFYSTFNIRARLWTPHSFWLMIIYKSKSTKSNNSFCETFLKRSWKARVNLCRENVALDMQHSRLSKHLTNKVKINQLTLLKLPNSRFF